MADYTIRFHGDTGSGYYQCEQSNGPLYFPNKKDATGFDEAAFMGHMAKAMALRPSMDFRLREALKPVISDISVLKPEKYRTLLKETHAALLKQSRNEQDEGAREAMADLITLLEENSVLSSLLDQYSNFIHKA